MEFKYAVKKNFQLMEFSKKILLFILAFTIKFIDAYDGTISIKFDPKCQDQCRDNYIKSITDLATSIDSSTELTKIQTVLNECEFSELNDCSPATAICIDTLDSFKCACKTGYRDTFGTKNKELHVKISMNVA